MCHGKSCIKPDPCANGHVPETVECPECGGSGWNTDSLWDVVLDTCDVCHGTGSITRCKVCGERMEEK
jgi:RecJ-like exonuclease